ncbi:MAG TPA: acetyl-CoA carboxylase biotin carboxylase subunit [Gammaproteobacteria bacterium]|nr:acetyl-CoA carboxylase biotin carboxylase subunit [Gammaproteobacteria bacterium]
MPIKKLLIANRGEIAVRIARACAEADIQSVAVYAEEDRFALHVKKANEAYSLGPAARKGYLNIHRLITIALASGCDALHPGYGFLSENPALPRLCKTAGIRFVGPSAEVIERMGDKIAARAAMRAAGVPVIPGSEGSLESLDQALRVADDIGYPVMLKATNGGGGRGIRRCESPRQLRRQYPRVISEAEKAFGSGEVFIEKCIDNPRHIEVQVLADHHGAAVHLFERDCSIQRRHQKLVEIAPSPQLDDRQRQRLGELALRAVRAVGYTNAGTVEFLMDERDDFYFMEMNTRLQVEHPVTEMVTGIDIVQTQLQITNDQPLPFRQEDIGVSGYAIEFRINAEDPKNDFLPSFGKITRYYAAGGPGVRTDGAIYTGYVIPPYFDSMCAKLIVWARDWPGAIARGRRALKDIGLFGVKTTLPYHLAILETDDFRAGRFDTGFVEAHPELTDYAPERHNAHIAAAVAAAYAVARGL